MSASASLVMGWRLDELCEIRTVEGKPRFSPDTGKPVKNPVDGLFILGKQVESPIEDHPCEWDDQLVMKVYSTGDGSDAYAGKGLRSYDLKKFVAGVRVAGTDSDSDGNGALTVVEDFDYLKLTTDALNLFAKLCESLDIQQVVAGKLMPRLYVVCYSSY